MDDNVHLDVTLNVEELMPEELRNLDKIGAKFGITVGDFVK